MEFVTENNRITIKAEPRDAEDVEIEGLRRQKERNDELERKLNFLMSELGLTE